MKGQVFTIAKLHYVNGVVYYIARANSTSLDALAENAIETTKSGTAKHPKTRVRTLVRFAEGLGLVTRPSKEIVQITVWVGTIMRQEKRKTGFYQEVKKRSCETLYFRTK